MAYRVLIVEDEAEWRSIFARLIEDSEDFEVAHVAGSAAEGRKAIAEQSFDGALIDIGLGDGSGVDLVALLAARQPGAEALVCTVFEDEVNVLSAIRAGARGYVLKQNAAEDLVGLLRQMRDGGAPLSPRIARHILAQIATTAGKAPEEESTDGLTRRELDVLARVAGGLTVKQTARQLQVAESTVRTHVKSIYSKLGVNNRAGVVREAARRRLV